jgi:hypothetical protein
MISDKGKRKGHTIGIYRDGIGAIRLACIAGLQVIYGNGHAFEGFSGFAICDGTGNEIILLGVKTDAKWKDEK